MEDAYFADVKKSCLKVLKLVYTAYTYLDNMLYQLLCCWQITSSIFVAKYNLGGFISGAC